MKKLLKLGAMTLILLNLIAIPANAAPTWDKDPKGFDHGLMVMIDGEGYWFDGPGSIEGDVDVPGHTWKQAGKYRVIGRHYNVGPLMVPERTPWWATEEPYGVLLYKVDGLIDVPPDHLPEKRAAWYQKHGYVHVHEFVDEDGMLLEDYVVYLKHTAVRAFYFDGGPGAPDTDHMVHPGIDYDFIPNW
jgi:hypothetical protein